MKKILTLFFVVSFLFLLLPANTMFAGSKNGPPPTEELLPPDVAAEAIQLIPEPFVVIDSESSTTTVIASINK